MRMNGCLSKNVSISTAINAGISLIVSLNQSLIMFIKVSISLNGILSLCMCKSVI